MDKKFISDESFKKIPFTSHLLSSALIAAGLLFAATIGVTFSKPHEASTLSHRSVNSPVADTAGIVPADVLGSPIPWSTLTGDGSN